MEFPAPRLKGIAIELPLFRYAVNVQDGSKQFVAGAQVKVTGSSFTQSGLTNNEGCFFGSAQLYKTYTMTVQQTGFQVWTHQFILVKFSDLPNAGSKNFPVIVRDAAGNAVSGAAVSITSTKPHSDSGTTGTNGVFEGLVEQNFTNTITVSKAGFQTYTSLYTNYVKVKCLDQAYIVIPVITLNV